MARVLKPGGAAVFNFAALDMLRGSHSVLAEEVRRYTPDRCGGCSRVRGSPSSACRSPTPALFPLMLAVRVGHRWRRDDGEAESGEWEITVPSAPVNGLLTAAVGAEALALRAMNMPIGIVADVPGAEAGA